MREILFALFVALMLIGCSNSPEDKAKKLIKEHMKEMFESDFSQYESVAFGTLDSLFTPVSDNKVYFENFSKHKKHMNEATKQREMANQYEVSPSAQLLTSEINKARDLVTLNLDEAQRYLDLCKEFSGWTMVHSFKDHTGSGGTVHCTFEINKDITKILGLKSVDF